MIYFFKPVDANGPVKIGYSDMPPVRMGAYQTWSPVLLEMLGQVPGSSEEERYIHSRLRHYRLHGEWFEAAEPVSDYVDACLARGVVVGDDYEGESGQPIVSRYEDMRRMRDAGETLQAIGEKYSITRERVRQILNAKPTPMEERLSSADNHRDRINALNLRATKLRVSTPTLARLTGLDKLAIGSWRWYGRIPSERDLALTEKAIAAIEAERASPTQPESAPA